MRSNSAVPDWDAQSQLVQINERNLRIPSVRNNSGAYRLLTGKLKNCFLGRVGDVSCRGRHSKIYKNCANMKTRSNQCQTPRLCNLLLQDSPGRNDYILVKICPGLFRCLAPDRPHPIKRKSNRWLCYAIDGRSLAIHIALFLTTICGRQPCEKSASVAEIPTPLPHIHSS